MDSYTTAVSSYHVSMSLFVPLFLVCGFQGVPGGVLHAAEGRLRTDQPTHAHRGLKRTRLNQSLQQRQARTGGHRQPHLVSLTGGRLHGGQQKHILENRTEDPCGTSLPVVAAHSYTLLGLLGEDPMGEGGCLRDRAAADDAGPEPRPTGLVGATAPSPPALLLMVRCKRKPEAECLYTCCWLLLTMA
jgi:hypothetical protein